MGSLLRYGNVIMGSCMPPDLIRKIDTQVINVAARGICGADRSIRIETLHFLTGVHGIRNQYVVRSALMLDSILRATDRSIRARIQAGLCQLRGTPTLDTAITRIEIPEGFRGQTTTSPILWKRTGWFLSRYRAATTRAPGDLVANMFSGNAPELQSTVLSRLTTNQFAGTSSWIELAAQILDYICWAPECALP